MGENNLEIKSFSEEFVPNKVLDYNFLLNAQINRVAMLLTYPRTYEDLSVAEHGLLVLEKLMSGKISNEYRLKVNKLNGKLGKLKRRKSTLQWELSENDVMHRYLFIKFSYLIKFGTKSAVLDIQEFKDVIKPAVKPKK